MKKIRLRPVPKVGDRSGKLVVVAREGRKLTCACDCGGNKVVAAGRFRRGVIKSCGCGVNRIQPGQRFGRLVVDESWGGSAYCTCDCGRLTSVAVQSLTRGLTTSCGCLRKGKAIWGQLEKEWNAARGRAYWLAFRRNGGNPAPSARQRCAMCREWDRNDAFPAFRKWAYENGYTDGKKLELIDPAGDYNPGNCRWS
jgi:hypothetical protein